MEIYCPEKNMDDSWAGRGFLYNKVVEVLGVFFRF